MPTYLNSNNTDAVLFTNRVGAKESWPTTEWHPVLPSGVTKTADTPMMNPVLDSALLAGGSGSVTKTIPNVKTTIGIRVACYGGSVSVAFSSASNTPLLNLVSGEAVEIVTPTRTIDSVIVTFLEGSSKVNYTCFYGGTLKFSKS